MNNFINHNAQLMGSNYNLNRPEDLWIIVPVYIGLIVFVCWMAWKGYK